MNIPAKIRRMSKRRQKIAIRRLIQAELQRFVGQPNSQMVRAEVRRVIFDKFFGPCADVIVHPFTTIEHIKLDVHLIPFTK